MSLGFPKGTRGPRGGCNSTGLLSSFSFFDFLTFFALESSVCPSDVRLALLSLPGLERAKGKRKEMRKGRIRGREGERENVNYS